MPALMDTSSTAALAEVNLESKKRRRRRRKRGKRQATDIEFVKNMGQVNQNVDGHISTKPEGCKPDTNLEVDSTPKLTQEHKKPDSVSTTNPLEKSACKRNKKMKQKMKKRVDGVYGSQGMDHADILSNLSLADARNELKNGTINRIMTTDQESGFSMTKESVIPALECANNAEYMDGHISTKPEGSKPDANLEVDSTRNLAQEHQKPDSVSTTNPLEKSVCKRKKKKKQKTAKKVDGVYGSQGMDHADILSNLSLTDACNELTNGPINQIMTTDQESGFSMTKESVIPPLECANNAEYPSNVANGGPNVMVVPRHIAVRSPVCSRRKLLILDINGLLADIVMPPPLDCKADTHISGRAIFKRPFYYDFLKFCCERFDVGIWSSRSKRIIDRVVDYLLGDLKHKLLFCWDMYQCTDTGFKTLENMHKPLVCKELRKLWEKDYPNLHWEKGDYDESNTLLLDDSPYKALLNPIHTGIFPHSYRHRDISDNSLGPGGDLRVYLEGLAITENIQKYIEQHPFGQRAIDETSSLWAFYSKVLCSLSGQSIKR